MRNTSQSQEQILALNVGSTSIKSRVFANDKDEIREIFSFSKGDIDPSKGHKKAFLELFKSLEKEGLIESMTSVGHRVVHGGKLKKSLVIGKNEIEIIKKNCSLAPLHNPYNLEGIKEAKKWFGKNTPHVAVFDTALYADLPDYARTYPIPLKLSKKYELYRYGFHGISHHYCALEAAKKLMKPVSKIKLVTIHLGGGSSVTAFDKGVAIDTSMGFTPLEGLVMGTRSGDIDPGLIFYLAENAKLPLKKIKDILINESGIFGLCGSKNMLDLLGKVRKNDLKAKLAFEVFVYRVQKYIGAYVGVLGGCDGIVFTGAVGAGDSLTRNTIMKRLRSFILKKVPVFVISPNEEKMIALETEKAI